MTLNHNQATATLTIDGLAICCFNPTSHLWDLAFLHKDDDVKPPCHHELKLQVRTHPPIDLPEPTNLITFETVNPQPLDYAVAYPHGFFDDGPITDRTQPPTTADELENFRWVLDLEEPHDTPGVNGLKKPSVPPTRVFISNALFYTSAITPKNLYRFADGIDPNSGLSQAEIDNGLLGRTNDRIAADIFCATGGQVVIRVNADEVARLDHRPGNPWQIFLTNLCVRKPSGNRFDKGDFHLFYDALDFTPPKLIIWGEPVTLARRRQIPKDLVSGRTDCDTVRVGTSPDLDILFT
jgi:hypothetical protein